MPIKKFFFIYVSFKRLLLKPIFTWIFYKYCPLGFYVYKTEHFFLFQSTFLPCPNWLYSYDGYNLEET